VIWEIQDYRVRTEPMNFILERRHWTKPSKKNPEGREAFVLVGYYSSLSSAVGAIPDDIALSPEVGNYSSLKARLEVLANELERRATQ
jgi:hypothetical protein